MRRFLKRTDTGMYKHGAGGWTCSAAEAYNYESAERAHAAKHYWNGPNECIPCIVVIRRKKPKVSDGERAFNAWWRAKHPGSEGFVPRLTREQKEWWAAAAKAARRRK